jgi:hypothetical protein
MPVKKKAPKSIEAKFNQALEIWQVQSEARYKIAMQVYEAQDSQTKEVMERIRDRIVAYSTGVIRIAPEGYRGETRTIQVDTKYVDFNAMYISAGIMSDLALVNIRIQNFEFPPGICADCGSLLRPKKARKK